MYDTLLPRIAKTKALVVWAEEKVEEVFGDGSPENLFLAQGKGKKVGSIHFNVKKNGFLEKNFMCFGCLFDHFLSHFRNYSCESCVG